MRDSINASKCESFGRTKWIEIVSWLFSSVFVVTEEAR